MTQDVATLVALLSAFGALLAALYARWQALSAKRSIQIALHGDRLAVYKSLIRFRAQISARGCGIKAEDAWGFGEMAELSEFYYPPAIHLRLDSVFERALKLLALNDDWEMEKGRNPDTANELNQQRHKLMQETRDDCFAISKDIKSYLRVGEV